MICLGQYIVMSFIHLPLYCGYVEFICSTKTSEKNSSVLKWRRVVRGDSDSLGDSLTFLKSEENWTLNAFLWGAAHQAPYIYDFGLPRGECMLKMPFFFLPCVPSCTQQTLKSLFCSSEEGLLGPYAGYRRVESGTSHTYIMQLLMINNTSGFFVSNFVSVVVLVH